MQLDINELFKVQTGWNNLKTKANLDIGKSKSVSVDLKKLSDTVTKEFIKRTVYNMLNTNVNNLEKNNTKIVDVESKIPDTRRLATIALLDKKLVKLRMQFLMLIN